MLAAVLGCGVDEPPSVGVAEDVQVVTSTDPVWVDARIPPEPLFRLGAESGGGPDMFTAIATVRFSESGRIIVTDSGAERVVVFNADGSHLVTHGTTGEGPAATRLPWAERVPTASKARTV